jgi:diaminohydroxyphosphoribosylaminopyrimidine deaminase/5-amino-6-(5-phosphoribosylamino)uracil reductase
MHERFMRRALKLARRGSGCVAPNPMVGCVLVRAGRVIGKGYHHRFGGPHAEIEALRLIQGSLRGCTAYVTLEPCCHYGKTPPCTESLIAAGVRRVVFAVRDPFPKVHGKGARMLRRAGIETISGVCETEAIDLIAPYLKLQRQGQPWVILKWAQSLDGKIATRSGDSQWISGPASRRLVHAIRGRVDAILVGVGTIVADDPLLTCRDAPRKRIATRIVLDPTLRIPVSSQLVRTAHETPTMVVAQKGRAISSKIKRLQASGVEVMQIPGMRRGLDLNALLKSLGKRSVSEVLVEGGARTAGAFCDAGLVDEAIVFVSPRLIGGAQAPSALSGMGAESMSDIVRPYRTHISRLGDDLVYRLQLSDPAAWIK